MNFLSAFAYDPQDTDEVRTEKIATFIIAGSCCLAGIVWSLMYALIYGWGLTAFLPALFVFIVGTGLAISHFTRKYRIAIYAQIICIMYISTLIQWSIGGMFDSGFVMVWSFIGPIVALMFFSRRQSLVWLGLFVINLSITVAFNDVFKANARPVAEYVPALYFLMNLGISSSVIFAFASYFVSQAINERERANGLLMNMLPRQIASILKDGTRTIADHHDAVSVLFADIVGSTPLFNELSPTEAVEWLNHVFSHFDQLVDKYGLEKIRTIGDGYMVASGVPTTRSDHAQIMCQFALDLLLILDDLPANIRQRIDFRIGINSGPLVAGVIGTKKPQYDVWGDTVNTASRMESHGVPGKIHISNSTYTLVKEDFNCTPRGAIEVKGKGEMQTWFLEGLRAV